MREVKELRALCRAVANVCVGAVAAPIGVPTLYGAPTVAGPQYEWYKSVSECPLSVGQF